MPTSCRRVPPVAHVCVRACRCHLAKVRLDNAKAQLAVERPEAKVIVHYYPFMIDPATAADGEEYLAYNERRCGRGRRDAPDLLSCSPANFSSPPLS